MTVKTYKSSFCTRTENKKSKTITGNYGDYETSDGAEIEFRNFKIGEVFNLYEDFIANSQWDVRDHNKRSTIVLGRGHMFYSLPEAKEQIIENVYTHMDVNEKHSLLEQVDNYSPVNFATELNHALVRTGLTDDYDIGTIINYNNVTDKDGWITGGIRESNSEFLDMLFRNGVRKISENHFAISGFNLIGSEISINDNVPNTISYHYQSLGMFNNSIILSVVNLATDKYMVEEVIKPKIDIVSAGSEKKNTGRNLEYFTNSLIKSLESSYYGKIIIKYNSEIEVGDTITLIDDINSMFGVFKIKDYEHNLSGAGMYTTITVCAFVDMKEPVLDSYFLDIASKLGESMNSEVEDKQGMLKNNAVFKNIYKYYLKTAINVPKYCSLYHKEEQGWVDKTYPLSMDNVNAPKVPLRFMALIKKGKAQIPTSLEPAFYSMDESIKSVISENIKNARLKFKEVINSAKDWAGDTFSYLLDFFVSLPTLGLHELLKPMFGLTYKNAIDSAYSTDNTTDDDIKTMLDGEIYFDGKFKKNIPGEVFSVGFFNVQAQNVKRNLLPFDAKENKGFDNFRAEDLLESYNRKSETLRAILNNSFDVTLCVEMYEGFKHEEVINIDHFADTIKGNNHILNRHVIYKNTSIGERSNEYGYVFASDKLRNHVVDSKPILLPIESSLSSDKNRYCVETTIDISNMSLNYGSINKIKFVWLHNLYGTDTDIITRRKNINHIVKTYNNHIDEETGVIIIGDFNLQAVSYGEKPRKDTAAGINAVITLEKEDRFKSKIKKHTTLNRYGQPVSNIFDNVLTSDNLQQFSENIIIQRYNYPHEDKRIVSDHLPVFVSFTKRN